MIPLGTLFDLSEAEGWQLAVRPLGAVVVQDGLTVTDADDVGAAFTAPIPAGTWPVDALVGQRGGHEQVVAVRVGGGEVARWALAVRPGEDPRLLGRGQVYGFTTRSGRAAVRGVSAVEFDAPEGVYPTYLGLDATGAVAVVVVDLGGLPLEPPAPQTDHALRRAEADRLLPLALAGDMAAAERVVGMEEDAAHLIPGLLEKVGRKPEVARLLGALIGHDLPRLADVVARCDGPALSDVVSRLRQVRPRGWPPEVVRAVVARWAGADPGLQARLLDLLGLPTDVPGELSTLALRALRADDAGLLHAALAPFAVRVWSSAGRRPLLALPDAAVGRVVGHTRHPDSLIREEAARVLLAQDRLGALEPGLDDPDPAVREGAAVRLLDDPVLRERAIRALEALAGPGRAVSERFEAAHRVPDPRRRAAVYAALAIEGERAALVQLSYLGGAGREGLERVAREAVDDEIRSDALARLSDG